MRRKLSLEVDALAVDSFETIPVSLDRGTVRGHDTVVGGESAECQPTPPVEYRPPCTCFATCLCPTNAYYCATAPATAVSCDYTYNDSCFVTPNTFPPEETA